MLIEATLPRPERDRRARPPHPARGRRARPRLAGAGRAGAHPHLRRARPALGTQGSGGGVRRPGGRRPRGRRLQPLKTGCLVFGPVAQGQRPLREFRAHAPRDRRAVRRRLRAQRLCAAAAASPRAWTSTTAATRRGPSSRSTSPASTSTRSALEIRGRQLLISGRAAHTQEAEGRLYQQIEIEHGPFRRVVELGADVDAERAQANYEDGVLRIDIPLVRQDEAVRRVPIEGRQRSGGRARVTIQLPQVGPERRPGGQRGACRPRCRCCRSRTRSTFPDTLTPLAVGQERSVRAGQRRARRQPDARDGRLEGPESSRSPALTTSTASAWWAWSRA